MTRFITDMGGPVIATEHGFLPNGEPVGETLNIGRYGVWKDQGRGKPECFASGDDLSALQTEHGPDLPVLPLSGGSHEATG